MKRLFFLFTEFAAITLVLVGCRDHDSTAGVRTDALDDAAWDVSEWISAADAPVVEGTVGSNDKYRAADGASWFVAEPVNEHNVVSAVWMTAGLGVYELYVNGKNVGEEYLKPGFTHPYKTKRSFTYDVTDAFNTKAGAKNQLAVQSTPGWWADKIVTPNHSEGMLGRKPAFRGVLEVTYEDGSKTLLGTDTENWKAGIAGPVTHAAIFDGEEYDARIKPGYATPELLDTPEVYTNFTGEILPSAGAEVYLREDIALKPALAYVWEEIEGPGEEEFGKVVVKRNYNPGSTITLNPGETLVVDFGQNAAAVPSFKFKAEEGTVLTCLVAELLNDGNGAKSRGMDGPEGSIHRTNLRTPDGCFRVVYTFGPKKGYVNYRPSRTFLGYRFVSITATDKVKIKSIESVPVTSIAKDLEIGTITTGSEMVNKLISNTIWGQRSNYLSVPTDCPQRNERLGWTADTQVFTETGTFFANTDAFFHKWMRDMRDTQSETGAFPGVAPLAQYGNNMMRLGWADAGIIVPWTVWKHFGDVGIIDENWEAMEKFINHIDETQYDHTALSAENNNYQWADWLSYEPLESNGGGAFVKRIPGAMVQNVKPRTPLPESLVYWNYLSACYWIMDAGMMCDMAKASGRDASVYEAMVVKAKARARSFLNEDGSFKLDILNSMQTPALFALKTGLVDGSAKKATVARLRENFAAHENCLQTGFLGTSILMATLTENGMSDIAYDLLFQRKNPSWLYSVDNGATTIWERWNSYTLEHGMGPKGMNSFNHYAYGCVCEWIWETVAGIATDTVEAGFKHIIMAPVPDKRLGSVEAEYKSAAGVIKSAWKYDGDTWTWDFTIPEGATATVTVPGEESKEYEAGSYQIVK
ncbi:MAG: family 78 glycoside hydrolase catalytic domain [Bacteroidales bacterium]|nr:family 78 glycoside hydrolase catalytic domain [Bacteroidales bacterium]